MNGRTAQVDRPTPNPNNNNNARMMPTMQKLLLVDLARPLCPQQTLQDFSSPHAIATHVRGMQRAHGRSPTTIRSLASHSNNNSS